jgi:hypothetical protein
VRAKGPPIHNSDPSDVIVSTYSVHGVEHFSLRRSDQPLGTVHDDEGIPRYLFLGNALMTLLTLALLIRQLPDFLVRSLLWLSTHGRHQLRVVGISNLPAEGPVILATNCVRFQECMQVIAATDRYTRFVLMESPNDDGPRRPFLRFLARRVGLIVLHSEVSDSGAIAHALEQGRATIQNNEVLALTIDSNDSAAAAEAFFDQLSPLKSVVVPVYCGRASPKAANSDGTRMIQKSRVIIGSPMPPTTSVGTVREQIRALGDAARAAERAGKSVTTMMLPEGPEATFGNVDTHRVDR